MTFIMKPPIKVPPHPQKQVVQAGVHGRGGPWRYATIVIAAADSVHPDDADFQCPGSDDDQTINAILSSLTGASVEFMEGSFHCTNDMLIPNSNLEVRGQGYATQFFGGGFYVQDNSRVTNMLINGIRPSGEVGVYLTGKGSKCDNMFFTGVFPTGVIYMAQGYQHCGANTIFAAQVTEAGNPLIYMGAGDGQTCMGNAGMGCSADRGIYSTGADQTIVGNSMPGGGPTPWVANTPENQNTFGVTAIECIGTRCAIGFNALNGIAVVDGGTNNQVGFNS